MHRHNGCIRRTGGQLLIVRYNSSNVRRGHIIRKLCVRNSRQFSFTPATACKIIILISLGLVYVVFRNQNQPLVTWSYSKATNIRGEVSQLSEKLWLKPIFDNSSLARLVQNIIGEEASRDLLARFNKQAMTKLCRFPSEKSSASLPTIYVITPTYRRPEQIADLTRLSQTLMHVEKLIWILIEDANSTSSIISEFLIGTGIKHVHLITGSVKVKHWGVKPRGARNRNKGIKWICENAEEGVMYFGDDDNTYNMELFDEMRDTKKVTMWPVGLVTDYGVSTPLVRNGKLVGFYDGWIGDRKFPVDMAGFAVNIQFLRSRPNVRMAYRVGYEEDLFLKSLAPLELTDIELGASNCTKILVWHTQTKKNRPAKKIDHQTFHGTNLIELEKYLV